MPYQDIKEERKALLLNEKKATLDKGAKIINTYLSDYKKNLAIPCDLLGGQMWIKLCRKKCEINKWLAYTHLTTSLPYKGGYGRQIFMLMYCDQHIIGMVEIRPALRSLPLRDRLLGWDKKDLYDERKINLIQSIGVCVPTRTYAKLLLGKLLIYMIFSSESIDIVNKYSRSQDKTELLGFGKKRMEEQSIIGFDTTSLYGKSAIYNRIPFLKYLGTTFGQTPIYFSEEEWSEIRKRHRKLFPHYWRNPRLLSQRHQMLRHFEQYYKNIGAFNPYLAKFQDTEYKRGVYFGFVKDADNQCLEEMVDWWRERWLVGRMERIEFDVKQEIKDEETRLQLLMEDHRERVIASKGKGLGLCH